MVVLAFNGELRGVPAGTPQTCPTRLLGLGPTKSPELSTTAGQFEALSTGRTAEGRNDQSVGAGQVREHNGSSLHTQELG